MATRRAGGPAVEPAAVDVATPHGPARVSLQRPGTPAGAPRALLVLGHGAGGGVDAPDLLAATGAALEAGIAVARVLQPYRVAGRRAPAPARQLDAAWAAVVEHLRAGAAGGLPLGLPQVHGGRSSGARVACRGAGALAPLGVLALAFPLHPPERPHQDRGPELDAVEVPVLVVAGERDRFSRPEPAAGREVVVVPGDHGLGGGGAVADAVRPWLAALVDRATG